MARAAIYCRVSTENQQEEGSSLDTQRAANLKKAEELGYQIPESNILLEVYSGADTDRPQLNRLRDMIRQRSIDALVCYSTDRLSRKAIHIGIIAEECEKNKVNLVFVTEPLDNSPEGSLIRYVKGYAAEIEREKIRERTIRGKKAKARLGKISSGSHARLYGYTYIPVREADGGRREINESEAKWVRQIYQWLVTEGISTNGICYKLRDLNIPTPGRSKFWDRSTVYKILRNQAYCGKTYSNTVTYGEPKSPYKQDRKRKLTGTIYRDKSEWIEIPNVTPQIISEEMFEAAQRQLTQNNKVHKIKRQYLLHGFLYCGRCSRAFWGTTRFYRRKGVVHEYRKYGCASKRRRVTPEKCDSTLYKADELENIVWKEIDAILENPKSIRARIEKLNQAPQQIDSLERRSTAIMHEIMTLDRIQDEMLDQALKTGFNQEAMLKKNLQINSHRQELKESRDQIQKDIDDLKASLNNLENLERFIELAKSRISKELTFEDKRLALRMLGIKVFVDGNKIEIIGKPIRDTLMMQSGCNQQNVPNNLAFVLPEKTYKIGV